METNLAELLHTFDSPTDAPRFSERFVLVGFLGRGSFGEVVHCYEKATRREVALKVLSKDQVEERRLIAFRREIEVISSLRHQNVVSFRGCFETKKHLFLATEVLKGGTLRDLIRARRSERQPFTEAEISVILRGVTGALEYIHGKDLVHRDIKPENIMFSSLGDLTTLKLIDFGLARTLSDISNETPTPVGTLLFMAPEVVRSEAHGKAMDIFGIGVLLYTMVTLGGHPIHRPKQSREEYIEILGRMDQTPATPAQASPAAAELLSRLLVPEPDLRPTSSEILCHPFLNIMQLSLHEALLPFLSRQRAIRLFHALFFMQALSRADLEPADDESIEEKSLMETNARSLVEATPARRHESPPCDHRRKAKTIRLTVEDLAAGNSKLFCDGRTCVRVVWDASVTALASLRQVPPPPPPKRSNSRGNTRIIIGKISTANPEKRLNVTRIEIDERRLTRPGYMIHPFRSPQSRTQNAPQAPVEVQPPLRPRNKQAFSFQRLPSLKDINGPQRHPYSRAATFQVK
eukprot:TRINITY_DN8614_c0_g1_i1.p1 TRINITY_DN8614_c0_g1~~TRINITY_DN8614_c0_g1_i1.p1  ORF type:complete len:520 (-),score=93.75 TRINITY_DN8614_c0_g1_i1:45-1604(-)